MGLSTTDLGASSSGLPKTIAPGNHYLKINGMYLEEFSFIPDSYHLMLNVETQPIDDFEGFLIDKDDESQGRYAGQIGRVKASQYAYADGVTKSGIKIQRDRSILIFLQNLSKSLGINDWFIEQDGQHDTIEDFVNAFNKSAPFKDKYLAFCVAGKEYVGKSGYTNYDLYLPKSDKGKYAYTHEGMEKVMPYNEEVHLKKAAQPTEVKSFGDDDFSSPSKTSSDFNLD